VLERAVGEAEVLRDLLLVVGDVLLEQYLVFLLENLDDDCSQELVEGVDAVLRIDGKGGVVLENELERTRDGVDTSGEAAAVLAGASKAGAPALGCVCGYRFSWNSAKGRRNTDGANSVGEGGGSGVVASLGSGFRKARRRRGNDRKFLTMLGIAWSCMACRMKGNVAGLASSACFS